MSQKMSELRQEAKSLAVGKRKKKLRSQQMTALESCCSSSTWRWDSSCGKSAVTRTLIGKSGMRTTTTKCAALLDSDILIKRITQSISILVHTYENDENPKKKWGLRKYYCIGGWSRVRMVPVKKNVHWKTRRASKLAPCHNALPQKRKAHGGRAPIWIEIFGARRHWETSKVRRRMAHDNVSLRLAKSQQGGG